VEKVEGGKEILKHSKKGLGHISWEIVSSESSEGGRETAL
jgi:hypothetical protein